MYIPSMASQMLKFEKEKLKKKYFFLIDKICMYSDVKNNKDTNEELLKKNNCT